jgi:ParB-like chromosome segregation protein Spo0J
MPRPDRNQLKQSFGTSPSPLTVQELTDAVYGEIAAVDAQRIEAAPTDIFTIHADVIQPRRTVVSEIRHLWDGKPDTIHALLDEWFRAVVRERYAHISDLIDEAERRRHAQFDLRGHLEGENDVAGDDYRRGPIETSFLRIVTLAASIRRDGLTNPITVAPLGMEAYRLETGERRWLAYHLLHAFFDGKDGRPDEREHWRRIPARNVGQASVWRMANENNVRADLNAIAKARQLALLLIDLYSRRGHAFKGYDELVESSRCDRAFYAQIADGDEYPIPRGAGDQILNAMGFNSKSQLREHRQLLVLPDPVWEWADDLNWPHYPIRQLIQKAGKDQKLLVELARREAIKDGLSVGIPTHRDIANPKNPPPLPENGPHKAGKRLITGDMKLRVRWLMGVRDGVGEADTQTKQLVMSEIENARRWLDEIERTIKRR